MSQDKHDPMKPIPLVNEGALSQMQHSPKVKGGFASSLKEEQPITFLTKEEYQKWKAKKKREGEA